MNTLVAGPLWTLWRHTAIDVTMRLAKPKNLRLVMDDGTEVLCACTFRCLDSDGFAIWSAFPERPVPAERVCGIEVDELPPWCGGIDVHAILTGLR